MVVKSEFFWGKKQASLLFGLCFMVYCSTYLGRLNYSASLAEIIRAEGMDKGAAGLIGTLFFVSYGAGQFISGILGDYLDSRKMVGAGLVLAAVCNLSMGSLDTPAAMAWIWCVNGLGQSLIWSPLLRLLSGCLEEESRRKACLYLNASVPVGTMAAYGMSAWCLKISGYRMAFTVPGFWLLLVAVIWMAGMKKLFRKGDGVRRPDAGKPDRKVSHRMPFRRVLRETGLFLLLPALCIQGALKDGVTTWVPVYLEEMHGLGAVAAVLGTMVIPVCNLFGVAAASAAERRMEHDEVRTAQFFYASGGLTLLLMCFFGNWDAAFSLLLLAVSTTCMMAVNTMLIAVLPSRYGSMGRASAVSGILNSCVYAGSALSTYGIGALSAAAGWERTIFLLALMAAAAWGVCMVCRRRMRIGKGVESCQS